MARMQGLFLLGKLAPEMQASKANDSAAVIQPVFGQAPQIEGFGQEAHGDARNAVGML